MLHKITLAAVVALVLPLTSQAQETYTIKFKKDAIGAFNHQDKSSTETETIKISDDKGNVVQTTTKITLLTEAFDQATLEKPDPKRKATLLKRTYTKATAKVDDDAKVMPYQGKTVVIEKKDDKFRFRYDGGAEITGDDAKWLDKEFNKEKLDSDFDFEATLLPTKAVAVGDTWKIDMSEIIKEFNKEGKMDADGVKASGSGKLLKAYKKDGRQHGDLQFKLEIPIKSVKDNDMVIPLQPGAGLVMEVTMSGCIDGSEMSVRSKAGFTFNGTALLGEAQLVVAVRVQAEETVAEIAKKK